jgi:hypothetical protein
VSDRTYAPEVESTPARTRGLPDDPHLEMQLSRHPNPDDDPRPPSPAALFPEVTTWSDDQLLVAIELADRREPALRLHATAVEPERYEAFLHECSAEMVSRLERRGVRFAA